MATQIEYAALSAHIYNDQRGGGNDSVVNRLQLPSGWQNLALLGFTPGDNLNNYNPVSFTGGAYLNQATGEIVVAYKELIGVRPRKHFRRAYFELAHSVATYGHLNF